MLKERTLPFPKLRDSAGSTCTLQMVEHHCQKIAANEDAVESIRLLCRIAADRSLPDAIFKILAAHDCWQVRESVCDNPSLPASLVHELMHDEHPDVRYALAENHNIPLYFLTVLAEDDNPYVSFRASQTLTRVRSSSEYEQRKVMNLERRFTLVFKHSRLQFAM